MFVRLGVHLSVHTYGPWLSKHRSAPGAWLVGGLAPSNELGRWDLCLSAQRLSPYLFFEELDLDLEAMLPNTMAWIETHPPSSFLQRY